MPASVASLHVFPVKACRATDLDAMPVTPRGPRYDREFMVTTPDGAHLSQREITALATVVPAYDGAVLRLSAPGGDVLEHEVVRAGPERPVTVHRKPCLGVDQGDAAATWLGTVLDAEVRLVRCPDTGGKAINPEYGEGFVRYVDGYPVSVVSTASLDELNDRLAVAGEDPVPMSRFRQNVVLRGLGGPHDEDGVRRLRLGGPDGVVLRQAKRDDRCVVTTIDQATGARTRQPLRALARYRTVDQQILFGVYFVVEVPGTVRVGDAAEVLEVLEAVA